MKYEYKDNHDIVRQWVYVLTQVSCFAQTNTNTKTNSVFVIHILMCDAFLTMFANLVSFQSN